MDAKDLLQQDTCHYHLMAVELNEVKHMIFKDWDIEIIKNHLEALKYDDLLARKAHNINIELTFVWDPLTFSSNQTLTNLG